MAGKAEVAASSAAGPGQAGPRGEPGPRPAPPSPRHAGSAAPPPSGLEAAAPRSPRRGGRAPAAAVTAQRSGLRGACLKHGEEPASWRRERPRLPPRAAALDWTSCPEALIG